MKIVGCMVARNEAWCLPASIHAAMQWLDELCVLVHASTDASGRITERACEQYPGRVFVDRVTDGAWNEADYRGQLHAQARELGATHVAIIDADEVLTTLGMAGIRAEAAKMQPGDILWVPWIHCWRSPTKYRSDGGVFGVARVPILFADHSSLRYAADADGYQTHKRIPRGANRREAWTRDSGMGVLHCQHVVWRRVGAKQRLYAMNEMLGFGEVRANYAGTLDEAGLELTDMPGDWWPVDPGLLDLEAEPWQEAEIVRLVGVHGRAAFAQLPEVLRI